MIEFDDDTYSFGLVLELVNGTLDCLFNVNVSLPCFVQIGGHVIRYCVMLLFFRFVFRFLFSFLVEFFGFLFKRFGEDCICVREWIQNRTHKSLFFPETIIYCEETVCQSPLRILGWWLLVLIGQRVNVLDERRLIGWCDMGFVRSLVSLYHVHRLEQIAPLFRISVRCFVL